MSSRVGATKALVVGVIPGISLYGLYSDLCGKRLIISTTPSRAFFQLISCLCGPQAAMNALPAGSRPQTFISSSAVGERDA